METENAGIRVAWTYAIAAVWAINGLYCKILDLVPRHREIVARILGEANAGWITRAIGVLELLMAVWVISGRHRKLNVRVQVLVIMTMNLLEFLLAPDLLLFGRMNIVVAALFCMMLLAWGKATSPRSIPKT